MRRGAAEAARGGAALLIPVTVRRNEAQDHWLARLTEHQARVRAWLAATRDPATRGHHATQQEGTRLASRAHALAAQGLVARLAGDVHRHAFAAQATRDGSGDAGFVFGDQDSHESQLRYVRSRHAQRRLCRSDESIASLECHDDA